MKSFFQKLHPAALLGLATTIAGVLADPALLALLPHKTAAIVTIAGAVIQAVTRAVHKGDVVETKKAEP